MKLKKLVDLSKLTSVLVTIFLTYSGTELSIANFERL